MTKCKVSPFILKDAPSLIEKLMPVQKLSVDVYKEREARQGQTLTTLGSYWKGRKPLVLNRACILASLLPATGDHRKDLEIFEMLMSMDDISLSKRLGLPKAKDAVERLSIANIEDYVFVTPPQSLPDSAPFTIDDYVYQDKFGNDKLPRVSWRDDVREDVLHELCLSMLPVKTYRELASNAHRSEEIFDTVHTHIWDKVNAHIGTNAESFPELVEQLGIMRFGHRPKVADTFSGSGQIPFEAARLGCDVYASDLNPIACMLTWAAFNIVGASSEKRKKIEADQIALVATVEKQIDELDIESDDNGWRGKVYLYCLEVTCPSSGWKVPVLPTLIISKGKKVVARLQPNADNKCYDIVLDIDVSDAEMKNAEIGTYRDLSIVHTVNGVEHRTKISTIRGDYTETSDGLKQSKNRLRQWKVSDVVFLDSDIYNERLYAVQWIKENGSNRPITEFRSVTADDLAREKKVTKYVQENLAEWQAKGWVPDMRIEPGDKTDEPIRTRGWTHWHHLFNPRQLLVFALLNSNTNPSQKYPLFQAMNNNCRLSRWHPFSGVGQTVGVFDNQALNTLYNYGCRGFKFLRGILTQECKSFPLIVQPKVVSCPATQLDYSNDIYITDPPYGDAVKYEEILEFFIAWMRKNPPSEFTDWVWDSRRALAIRGEDHDFKLSMVAAYKHMTECMPDNGLQIIMFTHQSNSIWADMANIVWASGLKVSAAWYIVTETDSALRNGQYVKGTILLVLRKRTDILDSSRDELAYEIEDEVKSQVQILTGLNQETKDLYRDESLFEDADLQMAGYAAALRVLTKYSVIDGVSMPQEALRPRMKGQTSMVDELIEFAVNKANEFLVPQGLDQSVWDKLNGSERFYLKMVDTESLGPIALSDCQNYAKAFKVGDYECLMDEIKANRAKIKSASGFGKRNMGADEFGGSVVRASLFGIHLLAEGRTKSEDVIHQLKAIIPNYYQSREQIMAVSDFLSKKTGVTRPIESASAMVLRDLVRNERT